MIKFSHLCFTILLFDTVTCLVLDSCAAPVVAALEDQSLKVNGPSSNHLLHCASESSINDNKCSSSPCPSPTFNICHPIK